MVSVLVILDMCLDITTILTWTMEDVKEDHWGIGIGSRVVCFVAQFKAHILWHHISSLNEGF